MKQCTECKTVYDDIESNFHRRLEGFHNRCKICRNKHFREYWNKPEVKQRCSNNRREHQREYHRKHDKTPHGKMVARINSAKRRARKLQRTPDYANLNLIKMIYKHCPEGYQVDHMRSLTKGGLHHESNLCYLPVSVNISKGNKTIEQFGVDKFNKHVVYWQDIL